MLQTLQIENFTVFPKVDLVFARNLNVVVGENGSGKSHLLKAAYCALAVSAARPKDGGTDAPAKSQLQSALADKLQAVYRPDGLWRLVRRKIGRGKCRLSYDFDDPTLNLAFTFSTVARTEVTLEKVPTARGQKLPVFLPTRELLTIYPGFVSRMRQPVFRSRKHGGTLVSSSAPHWREGRGKALSKPSSAQSLRRWAARWN
jgi:energy-coupling factor transporter ATP-binding protein EcfA2